MFSGVPHTDIDSVWRQVSPWIESACETLNGRATAEDIYTQLKAREMQLWVWRSAEEIELCVVTEIIKYPKAAYCRLCLVTGRNKENWQKNLSTIEAWAMAQGCYGMEAIARKGWGRILKDYQTTHIFIEKEF